MPFCVLPQSLGTVCSSFKTTDLNFYISITHALQVNTTLKYSKQDGQHQRYAEDGGGNMKGRRGEEGAGAP